MDIVLGIAFLLLNIPIYFFLFLIVGVVVRQKSGKRWHLYLLAGFAFVNLFLDPFLFAFCAIPGFVVGRLVQISKRRVRTILKWSLIGICGYIALELFNLRDPEVIISSLFTAVVLGILFLIFWGLLALCRAWNPIVFFFVGLLVGTVIFGSLFFSDVPNDGNWHWFDATWAISRIAFIETAVASIIFAVVFMFIAEIASSYQPRYLALLTAIILTYVIEPQLHGQISHPYWVHHPIIIPIFLIMAFFGIVLSRLTEFHEIFAKESCAWYFGAAALIYFFYHAAVETLELPVTFGISNYAEIMILESYMALALGIVCGRTAQEL